MRCEIITIGDELINGRVMNLNGWYASGKLTALGFGVGEITSVGDNPVDIARALTRGLGRSDFLIVTGGLGPTEDDITTRTVADLFERPLTVHNGVLKAIERFLEKRGLPWNPEYEKLALLPEGASMMDPHFRMCGFSVTEQERPLFFLPGVPEQMREMLDRQVIPSLMGLQCGTDACVTRIFKLFGLSEVQVDASLKELSRSAPGLTIGYYPCFPEVHIAFTVRGSENSEVQRIVELAEREAESKFGEYIFARGDETYEEVVGRFLIDKSTTISVAESCTGGLLSSRLTDVSGSSAYFERGFIVYSNRAKTEELGVPNETLESYGAVSAQTAEAMAVGAREKSNTAIGISITGIAGPTGGTPEKPVGTVYIGMATKKGFVAKHNLFHGTRSQIKQLTVHTALDVLRRYFLRDPFFHRI